MNTRKRRTIVISCRMWKMFFGKRRNAVIAVSTFFLTPRRPLSPAKVCQSLSKSVTVRNRGSVFLKFITYATHCFACGSRFSPLFPAVPCSHVQKRCISFPFSCLLCLLKERKSFFCSKFNCTSVILRKITFSHKNLKQYCMVANAPL